MSQTHESEQHYTTDHDQQHIDDDLLTLRALVSTKEAGVIIGKGNKRMEGMISTTVIFTRSFVSFFFFIISRKKCC